MTTVNPNQVPPKTVTPKAFPPRYDYGRPTNGGFPVAGVPEGITPANPPAGVVPDNPVIILPNHGGTAGDNGSPLGRL